MYSIIRIAKGEIIETEKRDHVDIELPVCYSNFLTIMYDTKEEVQRAYETMKEGSKTIASRLSDKIPVSL